VVEDVATDPKFAAAKDLLLGYDLRACWSVPIRDSKRAVLGTFAMYHRKPASPRNFEIGLVEAAAHLAGNAIERLRTEQRLASVAERLDIAERTAAFGIWELDLQSHAVAVSAGLARVLGWTAIPAHVDIGQLTHVVHPDDRARFDAAMTQAFANGALREDLRVIREDGEVRWVRTHAKLEMSDGRPRRAVGAVIDITDERQLLARIQRESDRLRVLQQASTLLAEQTGDPDSVLQDILPVASRLVDADFGALFRWDEDSGRIVSTQQFNGPGSGSVEIAPGDGLVGQAFLQQQPVVVNSYRTWEGRLQGATSVFRAGLAVPLVHHGAKLGVLMVATVAQDHEFDAEDVKLISVLADQVAAALFVKEALRQQRYAAEHDALTGLANRVLLNQQLDRLLAHAHKTAEPAALLLIDLDRFKEVNDTYGHGVGDELLHVISRRLAECVRTSDLVARLGGDEFAIVLPATDAHGAQQVARQVLSVLNAPVRLAEATLQVGASVGLAISPDHGQTRADLLRRADIAMYASKARHGGLSTFSAEMAA